MGISASILKRIQVVESKVNVSHCPELIMIHYDVDRKKYIINEKFMNAAGKEVKERMVEVDMMKDYIFPPEFMGVCIMDLFDAPVAIPNFYVINGAEVRREENIPRNQGFCIFMDENQDSVEFNEARFIVNQQKGE